MLILSAEIQIYIAMQNMKTAGKSTCLIHTSVTHGGKQDSDLCVIEYWRSALSGRSGIRLSRMLFSNKQAEIPQKFVYFHTKLSLQTVSHKGR